MNQQLIQTVQAIALLGSIILLSGAIVLLVVQYLKDLLHLEGKKSKRSVQIIAVFVGVAWGLATMRLPAALIWPDLPATLGGGLIGLLSGMSAIGGKSFTNGAIDRAALARANAVKATGQAASPEAAQGWADMWREGIQAMTQQIQSGQAPAMPAPQPQPAQEWPQPAPVTIPTQQPAEAPSWPSGEELTPVNVRGLAGLAPSVYVAEVDYRPQTQGGREFSNLSGVPIE